MVTPAVDREPLDVEAALDSTRTYAHEHSLTPSQAVDALLGEMHLTDEAVKFFVRLGMIYALNRDNSAERRFVSEDEQVPEEKVRSGRFSRRVGKSPGEIRLALMARYESATGAMVPLLDFSIADWTHLDDVFDAQAKSYRERRKLTQAAITALNEAGVETTKALPTDKLNELEALAERVLSA